MMRVEVVFLVATIFVPVVVLVIAFGFRRVYDRLVRPAPGLIRHSPVAFAKGALVLLMVLVFAGFAVTLRPVNGWLLGFLAACSLFGTGSLHYALAVRTELRDGRILFRRWFRPSLEVGIGDVLRADIRLWRYRLHLKDGRQVGISATADDIQVLHRALRSAGKPVPSEDELAEVMAARLSI